VVSTEDTDEIWETTKEEETEKVMGRDHQVRVTDGWVINRKIKIILLEFKRTSDIGDSYFQDMWNVTEKQYTPMKRSDWKQS
jgi:hypothetical protein